MPRSTSVALANSSTEWAACASGTPAPVTASIHGGNTSAIPAAVLSSGEVRLTGAGGGTVRATARRVTGPETTGASLVPVTTKFKDAAVFTMPSVTPYRTVTVSVPPCASDW